MKTKLKTGSILAAVLIAAASTATALQTINDSLEVTQQLTIRSDALLEGATSFGKLPSQSTAGYVTDVYQGVSTIEREEIIPEHYEAGMVWVDDYDWVYGTIWVDEWGYYDVVEWVPDAYDEYGDIVTYGYYTTTPTWGIVGGHSEQDWTNPTWSVVGSHEESGEIWVGEQRNTYTEDVYGIPVVRHTAQRHDVVWSWRNYNPNTGGTRELMELSPAGLSLPHPDVTDGSARAVLTSTSFEQSYTTPANQAGGYQSYGIKLGKDKIEAWWDQGEMTESASNPGAYEVAVAYSRTAQYKPEEILMNVTQPTEDNTGTQTVSTRIAASSATFGGAVAVRGALLVQPQGDLSMGAYTNGPQP